MAGESFGEKAAVDEELLGDISGDRMVQASDGLWYAEYTTSNSGLRLAADGQTEFESRIATIEQLKTLLEGSENYLSITIPDMSALLRWERGASRPFLEDIAMETTLRRIVEARVREQMDWARAVDLPPIEEESPNSSRLQQVLNEEHELAEMEKRITSLPPRERALRTIEKCQKYRFSWWQSNHPLVRLWGQLDCEVQVVDDATLILDIVRVLGRDALRLDEGKESLSSYGFVSVIGNAQTLKVQLLEKFAKHKELLDAIISRQA